MTNVKVSPDSDEFARGGVAITPAVPLGDVIAFSSY